MKILVGIPAYNEEKTLADVIREIKDVMNKHKYNYSILVLDDGSTDRTVEIAKELGCTVYSHQRNMGLVEAFKSEIKKFLESKADIFLHIDSDGQYPASYIPSLIKKIEEGYDLVLGSRFRGKIEGMPFMKRWGNRAFAKVLSKLTKVKLTDTTTGFRAFNKQVAREIEIINTFTYTQEQIIRATRQNFRIVEIPINSRKTRPSKLFKNPFEYAIKAWINIFRIYRDYEPLKFFGIFGGIFILIGLAVGIWLLINFINTGKFGHTPTLILVTILILIGIQIVSFGFLADKIRN